MNSCRVTRAARFVSLTAAAAAVVCGCSVRPQGTEPPAASVPTSEPPPKVLRVNPAWRPIRDIAKSGCAPIVGYAGTLEDDDCKTFFETDREATARAFRLAGARFVRMWSATAHFQLGPGYPNHTTDMKNLFTFYKEYGIKVMLTLENYGVYTNEIVCAAKTDWTKYTRMSEKPFGRTSELKWVQKVNCDFVRWIVANGFEGVVGGLELGNEPYGQAVNNAPVYASRWTPIVNEIKQIWPKAPIGIAIGEYFENDPDVAAIRNRALGNQPLARSSYFQAGEFNRWSARYIVAMSNCLHNIDHVIYHTYGGETPFSATYCGLERYRNFNKAFPELKGKKMWITEWRDRSDEDNWSHQRFRETLNKTGYMMMMVAQDDIDCMNLHQFTSLSGAFHAAIPGKPKGDGTYADGTWACHWDGNCNWRANYDDIHHSWLEPGMMGPAMRLMAEAFRRESLVMDFGSEKYGAFSEGCSNAVWSCSDYYNDMFHRFRQELRKGKRWNEIKPAGDDCEYLVLMNPSKSYLTFLAVNYKPVACDFELRLPPSWRIMPQEYRVYDCPEEYLDVHEVPGEGRYTRRYGYQTFNPQNHQRVVAGPTILRIPANSVTSVRIPIQRRGLDWAAKDLIEEALLLEKQGAVQFCAFKNGRCIVNVAGGNLSTNQGAAAATTTSLFPVFSTEKPLLATAVHRAVELGKMDYEKPLNTWWPEFTGGGREALTLGDTLAYRSGVPGALPKNWPLEDQCDWAKILDWAAKADLEITPGTKQRYMPRAYAWMLGHPLEVAMQKPLNDCLTDLVLAPAGITNEFYFVANEDLWPRIATFYRSPYCEVMNEACCRKACIPSSFAVASAHGIASFYNRLCGFDGKPPLLKKETLEAALEPSRHKDDPIPSLEVQKKYFVMVFGRGYGLWGEMDDLGNVFGHGGAGGSEGLCDRKQKLVVGFTCNFEDPYTYRTLRRKLYELVGIRMRYSDRDEFDIQTIQMKSR